MNFKFVAYLRTVRSEKPRIAFKAKELCYELTRRVSQAERDLVANSKQFLKLRVWSDLRYDVREDNRRDNDGLGLCEACWRDGRNSGGLNVDHKRNRRDYPQVALLRSNLQVLCGDCNKGKGNRYNTDWQKRPPPREMPSAPALAEARDIAPGSDVTVLLKRYLRWCKGKKPADNPDAAFLGWVKRVTNGKPPP